VTALARHVSRVGHRVTALSRNATHSGGNVPLTREVPRPIAHLVQDRPGRKALGTSALVRPTSALQQSGESPDRRGS